MKIILKENENLQGTGGYMIYKKRQNSNKIYMQYWGIYGNGLHITTEQEAKEKEWI